MANLLKKIPANINNTNNNNDINNTNNKIKDTNLCQIGNDGGDETASLPVGKPKEKDIVSQREVTRKLPAEWRGIKLDLYHNGANKDGSMKLRLNVGVIRNIDGAQVPLMAALNSDFDNGVRRGVDKVEWNTDPHWIRVKQHYKELKYLIDDVRASKVGKKSKHGGTKWVAFVYLADTTWCVDIMRDAQIYHFELTNPLTTAQQNTNMIATGYGGHYRQKTLIDPKKEWGI